MIIRFYPDLHTYSLTVGGEGGRNLVFYAQSTSTVVTGREGEDGGGRGLAYSTHVINGEITYLFASSENLESPHNECAFAGAQA